MPTLAAIKEFDSLSPLKMKWAALDVVIIAALLIHWM